MFALCTFEELCHGLVSRTNLHFNELCFVVSALWTSNGNSNHKRCIVYKELIFLYHTHLLVRNRLLFSSLDGVGLIFLL
jgi:hypothetical protein